MNYGKAIRICRSAHGLSQGELARRLSIGASQLSLIEAGKRQPSVKVLEEVSTALRVPPHLITVLASEPEDLEQPDRQSQITELGRALLQLLVSAREDQLPLPIK